MSNRIKCRVCGERIDEVVDHLRESHPELEVGAYLKRFPRAPLNSSRVIRQRLGLSGDARPSAQRGRRHAPLDRVFGLRAEGGKSGGKAGSGSGGAPARDSDVSISLFGAKDFAELRDFVPEIDSDYVFDPVLLRTVALGVELGIPVYLWGHAGVGKSSVFEQFCARTGRPFLRVQHSVNMEESQVVGQYVFRDGETVWEDGPLPYAMRNGMLYLADEYDFALPNVLSLYQPALEGKPLVIKEAPAALRVVRPHPHFRLCATGNTNGAGDDTGLYQGATLQNFANYERFGVVAHARWLTKRQEVAALVGRTGVSRAEAGQLVGYAQEIRRAHDSGKLGATISLRAMIHAAMIARGDKDWRAALALAFINRLNSTDREVCRQIAQRHFG